MSSEPSRKAGEFKVPLQELERRARRCAGWRWMPGMLTLTGHRVSDEDAETDEPILFDDDLPDLRDPATVGCLLALVRDVWGLPTLSTVFAATEGRWVMAERLCEALLVNRRYFWGDTEAEALVAALEAAGGGE